MARVPTGGNSNLSCTSSDLSVGDGRVRRDLASVAPGEAVATSDSSAPMRPGISKNGGSGTLVAVVISRLAHGDRIWW